MCAPPNCQKLGSEILEFMDLCEDFIRNLNSDSYMTYIKANVGEQHHDREPVPYTPADQYDLGMVRSRRPILARMRKDARISCWTLTNGSATEVMELAQEIGFFKPFSLEYACTKCQANNKRGTCKPADLSNGSLGFRCNTCCVRSTLNASQSDGVWKWLERVPIRKQMAAYWHFCLGSSVVVGSAPKTLRAKCSGRFCSPFSVFTRTCSMSICAPRASRSARYSITLVGFGAAGTPYSFIIGLLLCTSRP